MIGLELVGRLNLKIKSTAKAIFSVAFVGFKKYGPILGWIWLVSLVIIGGIVLIVGGPVAFLAYLLCKLSGVCLI